MTAKKVWANIPEGTESFPKATITLYQDGEEHGTAKELTADGNGEQEAKWENLLKYAPDGTEFVYTAKETAASNGYKLTISDDKLTFTNTYDGTSTNNPDPDDPEDTTSPENPKTKQVDITATKVWKGVPAGDKVPQISFQLTQNGKAFEEAITLEPGTTTATWTKLAAYTPDGQDFRYDVTEEKVPAGYSMRKQGFEITNTFVTEKPTITVLLGTGLNNNLGDCID